MEIRLEQLNKIFTSKDGTETRAVDEMNLVIPSGKLVGLLGPSGCGKSTTLYLIAGLHKATSGKIYFGDDEVSNIPPEKRGIGLVFQNYALYPHMTIRQNICFPLENMKVDKEEAAKRCVEMAKLVGLEHLLERKPSQLSGGQQQRVAIARALVKYPRVLLLDEPLSNLDARLRLQTREEIKRIQRETGITTIFVTHDQEEAMSISDEIVVMKDGVIQQIGAPQDVYDQPANLFVAKFLGSPQINVFEGYVKDNAAYIGEFKVKAEVNAPDQKVFIAIRPEGFDYKKENGQIVADVELVETIGRDTTLIIKDPVVEKKTYKAIVDAQLRIIPGDKVNFDIKENKMFIFDDCGELLKVGDK